MGNAMRQFAKAGLVTVLLTVAASAQQTSDIVVPELPTEVGAAFPGISDAARLALQARNDGRVVEADDWMVAAAHPLAVEAGARVLRAGGTAADAMVAVQSVLGLVEPQSSGLGGGAFWSGTTPKPGK
jgi:gamma-glutamyltranspeptidase / glutathione hydrolase